MSRSRGRALVFFSVFVWLGPAAVALATPPELRESLDRAARLFESGDYGNARTEYERMTELDPGALPAWRGLGWSLWQLGEEDAALDVWRQASRAWPNDASLLLALAQAYEQRKSWKNSLDLYSQSLRLEPNRPAARIGRARVSRQLRRYAQAKEDLRQALRQAPDDPAAAFLLAEIHRSTGRTKEALPIFQRLAARSPEHRYLRPAAELLLELGRPEEAIVYFERAMETKPDDLDTIRGLVRAHALLEDPSRALDVLEGYLSRHDGNLSIRKDAARLARDAGNLTQAAEHLRHLVRLQPEETRWSLELAEVLRERGEIEEPLRIARQVLVSEPQNMVALRLLYEDAISGGRNAEAIEWMEKLFEAEPNVNRLTRLGDLHTRLGGQLASRGEEEESRQAYAQAAAFFRRAGELGPPNDDALLGLATALRLRGEPAEAIEVVQPLLERYPNLDRGRRELYESWVTLGHYDQATKVLESTLLMFPGNVRLEQELARARFRHGERQRAIESTKQSLPGSGGVPVLLYHGLSEARTREDTMPLGRFREQMEMLKREGWQAITIDQLIEFHERGSELPEKAILITFDDARNDSFRHADPILEQLGLRATMFVPVAAVDSGTRFYANWGTVRSMRETGRWDLQCHSDRGHQRIPIDADGNTGAFLANRMWLDAEARLESREEFIARLEEDYRRCAEVLQERLPGLKLAAYAYPFGEMGQRSFSNEPEAVEINKRLARKHYRAAFLQDPAAAVTAATDAAVLPRFEVPRHFTADDLRRQLDRMDTYGSTLLLLADLYSWDDRFTEANALFEELASRNSIDPFALAIRRGRMSLWQGNLRGARTFLDAAQVLDPESRKVLTNLRQLNFSLSSSATAEGLFYGDNRDRRSFSIGPTGTMYLSDRVSLRATYRHRRFNDNRFDRGHIGGGATVAEESEPGGETTAQGAIASRAGGGSTRPRVALGAIGNEVETELAYDFDWRTGVALSAGAAQFSDASSERIFGDPGTVPLASARLRLGLGERVDASLQASRSYVGAAGAILDDLGSTGGEGRLAVRLPGETTADARHRFFRYDDGNQRNTTILRLLERIRKDPEIRIGYRFTLDHARQENPFFYTPERYLAHDAIAHLAISILEGLTATAELGLGLGQERGVDPIFQASLLGTARVEVGRSWQVYLGGGRSQAASFQSFQATAGVSAVF